MMNAQVFGSRAFTTIIQLVHLYLLFPPPIKRQLWHILIYSLYSVHDIGQWSFPFLPLNTRVSSAIAEVGTVFGLT